MVDRLTLEEVLSRFTGDSLSLSEDESSEEEGEGVYSYLGERSPDRREIESFGMEVASSRPRADLSAMSDSDNQLSEDQDSADEDYTGLCWAVAIDKSC